MCRLPCVRPAEPGGEGETDGSNTASRELPRRVLGTVFSGPAPVSSPQTSWRVGHARRGRLL